MDIDTSELRDTSLSLYKGGLVYLYYFIYNMRYVTSELGIGKWGWPYRLPRSQSRLHSCQTLTQHRATTNSACGSTSHGYHELAPRVEEAQQVI